MQAACGLAQLDRLNSFVSARANNHHRLFEALTSLGLNEELILPQKHPLAQPSWFGFLMILRNSSSTTRNDFGAWLNQNNIGTRLLFAGNASKQPYMLTNEFRISGELSNSDKIMNDALWVGIWPGLTNNQIDFIAETVGKFFGKGW